MSPESEPLPSNVNLESRFYNVALFMLDDISWPLMLHNQEYRPIIGQMLPHLANLLARPIPAATESQIRAIFEDNPLGRSNWEFTLLDNDGYAFTSEGKLGTDGPVELHNHHLRLTCEFDEQGRMTRWAQYRAQLPNKPVDEIIMSYDPQGYLTSRTVHGINKLSFEDRFSYIIYDEGACVSQLPQTMARTVNRTSDKTMFVDLLDIKHFVEANPYGYVERSKSDFSPLPFVVKKIVEEGIFFKKLRDLEHALKILAADTPLNTNQELSPRLSKLRRAGEHVLQLITPMSDTINQFVNQYLMAGIREQYRQLKNHDNLDATRYWGCTFGANGMGALFMTGVDVYITKGGFVLHLAPSSRTDSGRTERQLAESTGQPQLLRSVSLSMPINQSDIYDYFYIDLQEAVDQLGIDVPEKSLLEFNDKLTRPMSTKKTSSVEQLTEQSMNIWHDDASRLTLSLSLRQPPELASYNRTAGTAIWGPLNKESALTFEQQSPRLIIHAAQPRESYDYEQTKKTSQKLTAILSRVETASRS